MRDRAEVNTGAKQVDRGAMSPTVRMEPFSFQRRYPGRGLANAPLQDPAYSKSGKRMTTAIVEYSASFLKSDRLVFQVISQPLDSLGPKRTNPLLSTFPAQKHATRRR